MSFSYDPRFLSEFSSHHQAKDLKTSHYFYFLFKNLLQNCKFMEDFRKKKGYSEQRISDDDAYAQDIESIFTSKPLIMNFRKNECPEKEGYRFRTSPRRTHRN